MTTSTQRQPAVSDMQWRHRGSCGGLDPDIFFPVRTRGQAAVQARRAQRICRGCPVIEVCRDWALQTDQDSGIWGGLTERQRRLLLTSRRLSRPAAIAPDGARGLR